MLCSGFVVACWFCFHCYAMWFVSFFLSPPRAFYRFHFNDYLTTSFFDDCIVPTDVFKLVAFREKPNMLQSASYFLLIFDLCQKISVMLVPRYVIIFVVLICGKMGI